MAEPTTQELVGRASVEMRRQSNTICEIIEEAYGVVGRTVENKPITHPSSDIMLD